MSISAVFEKGRWNVRHAELPIVAIAALWTSIVLLVHPTGNFPINDDWAYALPVEWYLATGHLHLTFWQAMTLVAQLATATIWSLLVGFSFEKLRVLVALLAFCFFCAAYGLGRQAGLTKWTSLLVVLLFLVSPIFSPLAMSFMTDVPYMTYGTIALYFLLRALNDNSTGSFLAGSAFALAAILVRQTGIAIPIAFLCADLVKNGFRRTAVIRSTGLLAVAVVVLVAYPIVIARITVLPLVYRQHMAGLATLLHDLLAFKLGALKPFLHGTLVATIYFGIFAMPLSLAMLLWRAWARVLSWRSLWSTASASLVLFAVTVMLHAPLPLLGGLGILSLDGVGPRHTALRIMPDVSQVALGWWLLTAASAVSISFLMSEVAASLMEWRQLRHDRRRLSSMVFLTVVAILAIVPYGLYYGPWFDRYVLFSALPLLILVAMMASGFESDLVKATPLILGCYAAAFAATATMTHDFFTWDRARWALINQTIADRNLAPSQINGGFDYNNYTALKSIFPRKLPEELERGMDRPFLISGKMLDGYDPIFTHRVGQLLPMNGDVIFILQKRQPAVHSPGLTRQPALPPR